MSLTFADVQEILRIIDQSSTSELHLEIDDFKLIVCKHGTGPSITTAPPIMANDAEAESKTSEKSGSGESAPAAQADSDAPSESAVALRSPIAGTFYRAPAPGADPFVEVGDVVKKGTTVCILDVMKVMNMLSAPCNGRVCDFAVANAEAVSGGQLLVWFEPE